MRADGATNRANLRQWGEWIKVRCTSEARRTLTSPMRKMRLAASAIGLVMSLALALAGGLSSCSGGPTPGQRAALPTQTATRRPAATLTATPTPTRTPPETPTPTPAAPGRARVEVARVVGVIDGDTIAVELNGQIYSLRYIGIDAPEPDQPFGREASEVSARLVGGQTVELEKDVSEVDRYGRLLRYVWIGDKMINRELVCQGYATVATYPPDVKYQGIFLACEREAREAGRGFWGAQPTAVAPHPGDCPYIGNKNSKVFHHAWCSSVAQMKPANKVCFATREEALAQGYRPCKNCRP